MTNALAPTMTGFLSDNALEDFIQAWLVSITGLTPLPDPIGGIVRPAYQPDPPPLPPLGTTWLAFNIKRSKLQWDSIIRHSGAAEGSDSFTAVAKQEDLTLTLTFLGPLANGMAYRFALGASVNANLMYLRQANFAFVSATDPVNVSTKLKAKFQRRVDVEVALRRTVQFSYAVQDLAAVSGVLLSDVPPVTLTISGGN